MQAPDVATAPGPASARASRGHWLLRWSWTGLRVLLCSAATYYVGAFLYVACSRLRYPYDLEWMEGAALEHVARIVDGRQLYVAPTIDFTPFIYTPLYYWVCVPFVWIFGLGLPAMRAVSLLASLALFACLYLLVRGSTRDRVAAWSSVGLFAATYIVGGAWLDLARVDTLYLACVLAGVWLLDRAQPRDLWAGAIFGVAFLAKQTALMVVAPICLARLLAARGPTRLYCGLATLAVVGLSTALLDHTSGGWFKYYVFELPHAHEIDPQFKLGFWRNDLFSNVPFAIGATLYALTRRRDSPALLLRWAAAIGFLGAAWASRLHTGGWDNVLLPALLFLAWMTGEAVGGVAGSVQASLAYDATPGSIARQRGFFGVLLCLLQLGFLWYPPQQQIPSAEDRSAGDALVQRLAALPGPVFAPFHTHLGRLAGKPSQGHDMAFSDVLRGADQKTAEALKRSILAAFKEQRYAAIVVDRDWWKADLDRTYKRLPGPAVKAPAAFWMRTGWRIRPTDIYVPRNAAPPPPSAAAPNTHH